MKAILAVLAMIILIPSIFFGYLLIFHSYNEEDYYVNGQLVANSIYLNDIDNDGIENIYDIDADGDGIENVEDIIANARMLEGTFYEYLKGKYDNLGYKLGFIVCYDVPRIAYGRAGISLDNLINGDYKINYAKYNPENGVNLPNTQYFFRRTRNLYTYCENNGKLIENCQSPKPCDLIFYGKYHIAMVTTVNDDGTYNEIETAPWTMFVIEFKNKVWKPKTVGRILG